VKLRLDIATTCAGVLVALLMIIIVAFVAFKVPSSASSQPSERTYRYGLQSPVVHQVLIAIVASAYCVLMVSANGLVANTRFGLHRSVCIQPCIRLPPALATVRARREHPVIKAVSSYSSPALSRL
jgi:hypothetical protein